MKNTEALMKLGRIIDTNPIVHKVLSMMEINHLETYSHTLQVAFLVSEYVTLYKEDFTEQRAEDLIISALLHDVGKLDIDINLINKVTPLSEKEYDTIKKHSDYGYKFAKKNGYEKNIQELVHFHHYRGDVSRRSYPELPFLKKRDEAFMYDLQVLSTCDTFSAIVQPRKYKMPKTKEEALNEIAKEYFDVKITHQFRAMIQKTGDLFTKDFSDLIQA